MPIHLLSTILALWLASDAQADPSGKPAPAHREDEELTCGQELAASAEVPEQWQALMSHVATNMEWHATWVGTTSSRARSEHEALLRVARAYRAMAAAAGRAATAMKSMRDLPVAAHDPARLDRGAQARWMRAKIRMQRSFAALLLRHADESEKALAEMENPPAPQRGP
jgi:hypothetical protein